MHTVSGDRFGKLVVRQRVGVNREGRVQWECLCDCGKSATVAGTSLRLGLTRSCGCLRSAAKRTHGLSKTLAYASWMAMIHRCENPERTKFEFHGGRGITVCPSWHSFVVFYEDMGERPSTQHSLERMDNAKGYQPDNCVWATRKEQCRNTRRNVYLTHDGHTLTMAEWAERVGRPHSTLSWRKQQGWSDEEIINGRRK